ncbi:hypothetical protein TWF506_010034 [Arthrobotrys conoides]|uniref:Uncharacterized protein n=1 Tax=Arthrobotrys conoides TaxID=74498 RepID=A0AAN8NGG2_9PEZI
MPRCFKTTGLEIYNNFVTRRVIIQRQLTALQLANTIVAAEQPNAARLDFLLRAARELDLSFWRFVGNGKLGLYNGSEIMRYPKMEFEDVTDESLDELLDISGFKF